MEPQEVKQRAQEAIDAAVLLDRPAVEKAVVSILEEASPADLFIWVLSMVVVTTEDILRGDPHAVARAGVVRLNCATGRMEPAPIDEAPLGVSTYARICAAWINDDCQAAHAAWTVLFRHAETDGGEQVGVCMSEALQAAARRVIGARGALN